METNNQDKLQIDIFLKETFLEAAKWAKFIAIIGFISIGLMVIMGFFMGAIMSSLGSMGDYGQSPNPFGIIGGGFFVILYLVFALICFFPVKYLFDFSVNVKRAFEIKDQQIFTEAILKLKAHYKYIGILTIILISLYIIAIIGSVAFAAIAAASY